MRAIRICSRALASAPLVCAALVLAAAILPTRIVEAQATAAFMAIARQEPAVSLSAVRVTNGPTGPVVVITADGPLPSPRVGVLTDPNRIYLDFAGLMARAFSVGGDGATLTGIRVALHSAAPPVTRVVIDLQRPVAHKVDTARRSSGVIEVALQATDTPIREPAQAVRPALPAANVTVPPKRRPDDERQFIERVSPLLERLQALRPMLASIDSRSSIPVDSLDTALSEIDRVREELGRIRPPKTGIAAHDLLRSACGLTATALSLVRKSNEGMVPWEAASAAAGALILLDRARTELTKP